MGVGEQLLGHLGFQAGGKDGLADKQMFSPRLKTDHLMIGRLKFVFPRSDQVSIGVYCKGEGLAGGGKKTDVSADLLSEICSCKSCADYDKALI